MSGYCQLIVSFVSVVHCSRLTGGFWLSFIGLPMATQQLSWPRIFRIVVLRLCWRVRGSWETLVLIWIQPQVLLVMVALEESSGGAPMQMGNMIPSHIQVERQVSTT